MAGKKGARARHQGLERTDNDLEFTSWPHVNMINQKNYYTEYLKRDDQVLVLRLQNEENRNRMARAARDRDRALAHSANNDIAPAENMDIDLEENLMNEDGTGAAGDSDAYGSKVVVIHVGSQNLRIGLASDALPKTVPMAIARKAPTSEFEQSGPEPRPKRRKIEPGQLFDAVKLFGEDFAEKYNAMTVDLKGRLKRKGRRFVPNSREVAISYNRKTPPEVISEHNDTHRIDWTEIPSPPNASPEYFTGQQALRIPDTSNPRYKLTWPIRHGLFNEKDYANRDHMLRDFSLIIEDALRNQLGIHRKNSFPEYSCVFVVPDLYERSYVATVLDILLREFRFGRVCFIQESLSASFGAGYSTCVVVDVGAEKTSICCVEEGLCVESSRINLKYGGEDTTDTFMKMLLFDQFPYADLNMKRRYDFVLAEELKHKFCTLVHDEINVSLLEFYVRAFGQDTRHYTFKTYDETMLAPMGFYFPEIFDNTDKLKDRRKLIQRSYDLYDGSPNDPFSSAQAQVLALASQGETTLADGQENDQEAFGDALSQGQGEKNPQLPKGNGAASNGSALPSHLSAAAALGREDRETTNPARESTPMAAEKENASYQMHPLMEMIHSAEVRDRTLPTMPLNQAVSLSIEHGARGDERKLRDFYGGIMAIGGGAQIPGFTQFLEEELRESQPRFRKDLTVAQPPREIDPQVLVWKGASVFGKLRSSNDTWISSMEYDRLGSRLLAYKCLWPW